MSEESNDLPMKKFKNSQLYDEHNYNKKNKIKKQD